MPFWIAAAFLTLLACLPLLLPLARRNAALADDSGFDVAVYRDQLAELDRDAARGAISETEAAEARAEIGRRILKASAPVETQAAEKPRGQGFSRVGRLVASAAVLAVPLASWGIYAAIGSPGLPAQPLSARLDKNPAENTIFELVARAERHLEANPEDGRGWEVIAPIYQRIGRYQDAATAYGNAIRLTGSTAAREIGLGEALTAASGGAITAEARGAFERALALEPRNPKARFLTAAALAHEGRSAEAAAAFRALLDDLPEGSPWRPTVAEAVSDLEGRQAPGPTAADVEAAGLISDKERAEMIGEMVAGLDERLRRNPDDPEGWQRLVRSYAVLNRADDAADALKRGVAALGAQSEAAAELRQLAASLGVNGKEQAQ
ncbi:MAG: c-type cytochrome biogenesis protein CcmI [Aquamicrobium sp.]|uniref:c-type cytochrome biogenesis protein CcmI n=1 Tax=Aquamicrobium sp. TaxID=1872579 RepID=UPI00349E8D47|nr:c-type cytochrome biogenesis protein CcmI [Aquamicrobium sp.]